MDFDERLDNLEVEATSPDKQITARMRDRSHTEIVFEPYTYHHYNDAALARQLVHVMRLVWTRYEQDFQELVDAEFGNPPRDDAPAPEHRAYHDRLAEVVAKGASPDGLVQLTSRALHEWTVELADDTVSRTPESTFLRSFDAALHQLLYRHRLKVLALKDEMYGLGLPFAVRLADEEER